MSSDGPGAVHRHRQTTDFKLGVAYATHLMLHTIGHAHGETDMSQIADIESEECCQKAIRDFALGLGEALYLIIGFAVPDHVHDEEEPCA